jgi:hypothetical protein
MKIFYTQEPDGRAVFSFSQEGAQVYLEKLYPFPKWAFLKSSLSKMIRLWRRKKYATASDVSWSIMKNPPPPLGGEVGKNHEKGDNLKENTIKRTQGN